MKFLQNILIFSALAILFVSNSLGQNYNKQFNELFDKNASEKEQLKLLKTWEKNTPDDAELFVAYYNFYANKSRTTGLGITTNRSGTFLGGQSTFDEKHFKQALDYINKGIEKFPNRLDMRFGKTFLLGQNQQYKDFTDEIVKAVEYSNVNKNQWLWMENKPVENPQKFMLGAVQDYVVQLFDSGVETDDHTNYIKSISETVLKYYPNSVENLSNLSIYYLFKDDFNNALIHLLKAEKLVPQDTIVLNNIANCYAGKGDKENAVKYYNLVIKYGNDDQKADAKRKIIELKKKK
jgi:tetratricopeptide (TPR) repeat protein